MISSDPITWIDGENTIRSADGMVIRSYRRQPVSSMEMPTRITPKVLIAFIDETDPDGPIVWSETLPVRNLEYSMNGSDDFPTMTIEVALVK